MHSMRQLVLFIHFIVHVLNVKSSTPFGTRLVSELREDANLDLPVDEEYEDLRAELLAYHTALATLTAHRRSLITTPCWNLGGVCINSNLCTGFRSLTEVPGCKDKLKVCCFAWNRYNVRDWRDFGLMTLAMPWSKREEFGGKGLSVKDDKPEEDINKPKKKKTKKLKKEKSEPSDADLEKSLRSPVIAVIMKDDK